MGPSSSPGARSTSPSPHGDTSKDDAGFSNWAYNSDEYNTDSPSHGHNNTTHSGRNSITTDTVPGLTDQEIELSNSNFMQMGEKLSIDGGEEARKVNATNMDTASAKKAEKYRRMAQEMRDREPLRFCKWIAEKPIIFFGKF